MNQKTTRGTLWDASKLGGFYDKALDLGVLPRPWWKFLRRVEVLLALRMASFEVGEKLPPRPLGKKPRRFQPAGKPLCLVEYDRFYYLA